MGLLIAAKAGVHAATAPRRPAARIWRAIASVTDHDFSMLCTALTWMPAHTAPSAIGERLKSNGKPVSAPEWRANQLADCLAKSAAHESPERTAAAKGIHAAQQVLLHAASQLGCVTLAANNHEVCVTKADGTTCTVTRRDATAPSARRHVAVPPRPPTASPVLPPPVPTVQLPTIARRSSAAAEHRRECSTRDQQQVQRLLGDMRLSPAVGPPAADRLAALRQRIAARQHAQR